MNVAQEVEGFLAKGRAPGCANAAGRGRQKWQEIAGTQVTNPGARLLAELSTVSQQGESAFDYHNLVPPRAQLENEMIGMRQMASTIHARVGALGGEMEMYYVAPQSGLLLIASFKPSKNVADVMVMS